MSWWDSAYRRGNVPWDPGIHDGHLPGVLARHSIEPCALIDLGCGTGKSAVWLAEKGFSVTGVDFSPPAIEQALTLARRRGVDAQFLCGSFPEDFQPHTSHPLRRHEFGFAIERAFVQHLGHGQALGAAVRRIRDLLVPDGLFYSLMLASEGAGRWGITRWSEQEIRGAFEPSFQIIEMRLDVFTPGEPGSEPAWLTVMRPRAG